MDSHDAALIHEGWDSQHLLRQVIAEESEPGEQFASGRSAHMTATPAFPSCIQILLVNKTQQVTKQAARAFSNKGQGCSIHQLVLRVCTGLCATFWG